MCQRIYILLLTVLLIFSLLFYRLYDLQINENDAMLKKVASQRLSGVNIQGLRGIIYDRNLIPLTDNDEETNLIIFPQLLTNKDEVSKTISSSFGLSYYDIQNKINKNKPFKYTINNSNDMKQILEKVNGILAIKSTKRYGESTIARHILGYVDLNNNGIYGIEKQYNSFLKRDSSQEIGIIRDSTRRPLMGYGYRAVNGDATSGYGNIKLTIDRHIQNIIESKFDKYLYNGAAVMLDCKTGDILAMVSRPNFDQNNISQYFNSSNKELINKTTYPYNIGSLFKIVIAYAALEEGIVKEDDHFYCPGYIIVDGQMKKCASFSAGGHGDITFKDAFAKSCNTVFIELGLKLGHYKIIETAKKFGLGEYLGIQDQGIKEEVGFVEHKKYVSNRETANISIGQGEILVSPIQVANMINTIANNGIVKKLNIVDSIVDDKANIIQNLSDRSENYVFNQAIVNKIKVMMNDVIETGTGSNANIYQFGGGAGKTSSAETGVFNGDQQIIHAWFGGFFPNDNPKYSLVIIIEDGKSGAKAAAPLFGEIASEVMSTEK